MAFTATLESINDIAKITLSGELDASTAATLKAEVEKAASLNPKNLVLIMTDLEYMASAGLRMLIFAKQQMKTIEIYLVDPQEMVLGTIQKTGFDDSVTIWTLDQYKEASLETA